MLRKLIVLAATAALAKKAWDQYQASQSQSQSQTPSATDPLATAEDAEAASVTAQPVTPESPMQYH